MKAYHISQDAVNGWHILLSKTTATALNLVIPDRLEVIIHRRTYHTWTEIDERTAAVDPASFTNKLGEKRELQNLAFVLS